MPNKAGKKSKASKDALAKKRLFAELISTEETYVAGLETLTNVYKRPMLEQQKKLRVQTTDVTSIFSNVDAILQLHKILLGAFRDAPDAVVKTLGAHSAYFKMYTQYMSGYELALGTMDRLRKNKSFQAFLVSQQESGDGKGSSCLDIMSYLITPVQRIPRYELLLREILKHTPDRARDRKATQTAFDEIRSIASHINEQKREVESLSKLIKIQNGIRGLKFALFEPHRHLCKEGALLVQKNREKPKERIVFLFNDILLWTNLKNDYKGHLKVEELKYVSEAGADTNASAGDGSDDLEFVVTGGKIMLTIKCSVAKQKHEWVAELRAQSEKWRKTIADQAPRIELKERQDELKQREEQAQQEKRKVSGPARAPLTAIV